MPFKQVFSIVLFSAILFSYSTAVHAAPGDVDLSFTPPNITSNSSGAFHINVSVMQPDGKIIIGGEFDNVGGLTRVGIARLNSNGTQDTSFVSPFVLEGTATTTQIGVLILQTDGKILVGGLMLTPGGSKTLVRVNSDGSLDPTFSVPTNVLGVVTKIVLITGGQMLVSGNHAGITLLSSTGSFVSNIGALFSNGGTFVWQTDGKIIIGGREQDDADWVFRYNGTTIDSTFHGGTILSVLNSSSIRRMELQPDGRILMCGNFLTVDGLSRRLIVRLTSSGTVDTTFDAGNLIGGEGIGAMKLQADNKILIGGYFSLPGNSNRSSFARLNADGTLDTTYPVLTINNNVVRSIITQPDGKIILTGDFTSIGGIANRDNSINVASTGIARVFGSSPTAAGVSVGGRVLTPDGRGLRNAIVTLTDQSGVIRRSITSSFGYYRFEDVQTGETYIISVRSRRFQFANPTQVLAVSDEITNMNFTALP